MNISDLFPVDELEEHIATGLVTVRYNEDETLAIYNYTDAVQFSNSNWNDITKSCRGLIAEVSTGRIVARPIKKFFNFKQVPIPDESRFDVYDKADGSLIVAVNDPVHGLVIATRGSFASEQAETARYWIDLNLGVRFQKTLQPNITYLFEWVGPSNPIVLTYPEDKLVYLTQVDNETGISSFQPFWFHSLGLDVVNLYGSFDDPQKLADALPEDGSIEGVVLHWPHSDERLKIKTEVYQNLHHIIFGLSKKGNLATSFRRKSGRVSNRWHRRIARRTVRVGQNILTRTRGSTCRNLGRSSTSLL